MANIPYMQIFLHLFSNFFAIFLYFIEYQYFTNKDSLPYIYYFIVSCKLLKINVLFIGKIYICFYVVDNHIFMTYFISSLFLYNIFVSL